MTKRSRSIDPRVMAAFKDANMAAADAERIVKWSCLSTGRIRALLRAGQSVQAVPGDSAEIGAAAGGTSRLMALLSERTHWVCDTFDGLVDVGEFDGDLTNGMFHNTRDVVSGVLSGLANVQIVAGTFPESAPPAMRMSRFRLVHIDVDTYRSIHDTFAFFSTRMSPGAIIAIDDAIGRGTAGGKRAWSEIESTRRGWRVIERNDPQVVIRFD